MSTSGRVSSKSSIRINQFWMSETKGRNREDTNRGCCLSIALHPLERMTVNRPWTCSPTTAVSATAALSADNNYNSIAPFARASDADRNCRPGYLSLPPLYQEETTIEDRLNCVNQTFQRKLSSMITQKKFPVAPSRKNSNLTQKWQGPYYTQPAPLSTTVNQPLTTCA